MLKSDQIVPMKKNFFVAVLAMGAATVASISLSAPAKAAQAEVDIQVEIPDVVFLETFDTITFRPTLSELTGVTDINTTFSAGNTEVTGLTSPTLSPTLGNVNSPSLTNANKTYEDVLVYKFWGLGGDNGNIRHTVTYNNADLTKGNNSVIDVVSVTGNDSTGSAVTAPGLDYNNAIEQTLDFTFNFTGVKESGIHTGGVLTITATAE